MMRSEKGFTMVEALIALAGFLVISTVCLSLARPVYQTAKREAFLNILKADFYYAQMYALSHQRESTIIFKETDNAYYAYDGFNGSTLIARNYPKEIKAVPGSMPLTVKFVANGNVNRFGSFFILTEGRRYRLTILIGRGKFYIAEE
ncbi:type II secretion system protein [Neobacillus notoginsengisoli]|uniref:Type II secretion system protein n=1 Tax=Neobacillus notoginsengisoli TaxID=1578198 RepID=A0A417YUU9_9BACI|nr:competence type IV pilus minor pilin ComGD [Neobacillus notoginsengisoli]RHW41074.1 type II secretion system protein [Neobacillus notoginsengisoli]